MTAKPQQKLIIESSVLTLGWTDEHADAYYNSLSLQKAMLRAHNGLIIPDYLERSGDTIFIRSVSTSGRPVTLFTPDSWSRKPGQLVILAITCLENLIKIHSINTLHRNITPESVFLDSHDNRMLMTSYGIISTSPDFKTALHSYVPYRFISPNYNDILLYSPPLADFYLQTGSYALHLTDLRKFLAITPTERVRFNIRFSPLTDLYQIGFFLYKLLTQEAPPSPFALKYYDAEPGWKRAREDALAKLGKYGLGPFCNEFILRLLCLSKTRFYLSAAEAHSDIFNYWKAIGTNPALLMEAALPKNMPRASMASGILFRRMLTMRLSFNDANITAVLKSVSDILPTEFKRVFLKADLAYMVERYTTTHPSVALPEIYNAPATQKSMTMFTDLVRENVTLQHCFFSNTQARTANSPKGHKQICCLAGLSGAGKTALLSDLIQIVRENLLGFCLYVPIRDISGSFYFDAEHNLYSCDATYYKTCHTFSTFVTKLSAGISNIDTPEQIHELASSVKKDCTADVLSCVPGHEWSPMLYLSEDNIRCKLTHSYVEYGGEFHIIALYLAQYIIRLRDKSVLGYIRQNLDQKILAKLPYTLPALAEVLDIQGNLEHAKAPVAVDYYEIVLKAFIRAILMRASIFVLILDDIVSEQNKDFVKKLYNFLLHLSGDRFYIIFSESLLPCIYPDSFSWAGSSDKLIGEEDVPLSPVSGKPYTRIRKILSAFKILSKESQSSQSSTKAPAQQISDDARSVASVNSTSGVSVLSTGTKQGYQQPMNGGFRDGYAQTAKIRDLFARPYTYNLASKRMLNPTYIFLEQVPDSMTQNFILRVLMLGNETSEGWSHSAPGAADLVEQIIRKSGSVIYNIKLILLTLYSISGVLNTSTRYNKAALDSIPDLDQVILRRFLGLRGSMKLQDRDLGVLCAASVFGSIFDMRWITSALNLGNDDTILTSLTELSNMHLISCAPQFVQLRHPLYAQGAAEHGSDMSNTAYFHNKAVNRVGYIFSFNNISLCKVLEELFTSVDSQKLFNIALYMRKRWMIRDSVLERKSDLKPCLYIRNYDPKELDSGELLRKLHLDFMALTKVSGKSMDVSINDLQINKASFSLRLALRTQTSYFFDSNIVVSNWQHQELFLKQAEADLRTPSMRACLLEQYDGLFVDIGKLLQCLNPCANRLTDIYDQYELLRLNTYACNVLSKSFTDISKYLAAAKAAEREIWYSLSILCLDPIERQSWALSNYKSAAQKRSLLVLKSAANLDIDSLLKCSVGVLSNANSAQNSPITSENTDAQSNKPNALQGLVGKSSSTGVDQADVIETIYGEGMHFGSESELTALYNAFPLLFNFTCANSIHYSIQAIRFTTRYNVMGSTYVTTKLSDEVYKHYWLELIWEWTLAMIQFNRPARAVLIAVTMLQKLFGSEPYINAFLPLITLNQNIHRDTIVANLSLLFTTNLVEGNGLRPHTQAAISAAFDALSSPSTPYALIQYMKRASLLERSLQKLLFLIFYALLLRDLTELCLSLAAAMVERCLLYGSTIEGIAMIGILAAIAPSYIPELPRAAMLQVVKAVAEVLRLEELKAQKQMASTERSLQSYNFIPPLISCIFELTVIHIFPYINQSVHSHLVSYKHAIYLLPSDVVENVISQPLALCLYATSAFLSFQDANDLSILASECQNAYNNLVAIKECVFNVCIYIIARCCKYFLIQSEMSQLKKEGVTFTPPAADDEAALAAMHATATTTSSSTEVTHSKGAKAVYKEALPDFDNLPVLTIQYMRSDASVLPSKLIASVLLEAYCRAGMVVKALYTARRILQIFQPASYGFINMLTFTRVALVHIAVVDMAIISQRSVEYLVQSILDIMQRSTDFKGTYKRMSDIISAGHSYIKGCHISNVLYTLSQHRNLTCDSKPLQEQLAERGALFFLNVLLTT